MSEISTDFGRRMWWVDAFIGEGARGNPAVVVLLESDLATAHCQQIAAELGVSETACLRRTRDGWDLRCFTPTVEVDLFGHATLAALHVLATDLGVSGPEQVFTTRSGPIVGRISPRQLTIELPRHEIADVPLDTVGGALGALHHAWTTEAGALVALVDYSTENLDAVVRAAKDVGGEVKPLVADLPRFSAPLTLVAAQHDRAVPPSVAEQAMAAAPRGMLIRLSGLGHLAHEEAPHRACEIIRAAAAGGSSPPDGTVMTPICARLVCCL